MRAHNLSDSLGFHQSFEVVGVAATEVVRVEVVRAVVEVARFEVVMRVLCAIDSIKSE